jgi:hypothetical protein
MSSLLTEQLILVFENKFTTVSLSKENNTLVCEATASYIPMDAFKELFAEILTLIRTHKATKLVFDKRKLNTFHQPSMEWYHTEWKDKAYAAGVKSHRKILPADNFFRKSVEIGRAKIAKDHPHFDFTKYDIKYVETVEEGIQN